MPINAARLEHLAVLLDRYKASPNGLDFDLRGWTRTETKRRGFWRHQVECHTAACAVGLACLSADFKSEGLSFLVVRDEILGRTFLPHFEDAVGWDAVHAFFGLSIKQSDRLFDSDRYVIQNGPVAAATVAARIRAMVRRSDAAMRGRKNQKANATVAKIKTDALREAQVTDDRIGTRSALVNQT